MSGQPPQWAHSAKCLKCETAFGMFNRKHHCRNCGQTFCGDCSKYNSPLPHYGMLDAVRVCEACLKKVQAAGKSSKSKSAPKAAPASATPEPTPQPAAAPQKRVKNCTCGMPLCVCPPDEEEKVEVSTSRSSRKKPTPKKKPASTAAASSTTSAGPSLFFSSSSSANAQKYDMKGDLNEQCREAIKADDVAGVRQLLEAKANASYKDRSGNSLLHLAAMFNKLKLVEMLMERGASISVKNDSKETPLDVAPPSLAHKMKALAK